MCLHASVVYKLKKSSLYIAASAEFDANSLDETYLYFLFVEIYQFDNWTLPLFAKGFTSKTARTAET